MRNYSSSSSGVNDKLNSCESSHICMGLLTMKQKKSLEICIASKKVLLLDLAVLSPQDEIDEHAH